MSGSALTSLGLSQLDFLNQAHHYGQALAQDTRRKLALLVGINTYSIKGLPDLKGCLTDVRMQYELLVNRFGFLPEDIVIISDDTDLLPAERIMGRPTRNNILTSFEEHLIKQAKPDDVVVFHYSGHGAHVYDRNPIPELGSLNGTIVPTDARDSENDNDSVKDIMGKTLFLLTSALATDNVTTVLDCCYAGGGIRGGLVYRSTNVPNSRRIEPHADELAYQERWMSHLGLNEKQLLELRTAGIAKGMALGATQKNLLSTDATFGSDENRFSAGAFSYILTRYMWQQSLISQPIANSFAQLALSTRDVANEHSVGQEPVFAVSPSCGPECDLNPIYFLAPNTPAAEAVLTAVKGNQAQFWMGGISSRSVNAFRSGSTFDILSATGDIIGTVTQTHRQGLIGAGTIETSQRVSAGMFLREHIRGVPPDLKLLVALDPSLGTDTSTAKTALELLNRVRVVSLDREATEFDYILGYMNKEARTAGIANGMTNLPPDGSLCIFSPGLNPIPNSWHPDFASESIVEAIQNRLANRFKLLLAGRILKYILNTDTSDMNVGTQVVPTDGRGLIGDFSSRGARSRSSSALSVEASQTLIAGTDIQIKVSNNENQGLYMAVLVVASSGALTILHPATPGSAEISALVPPGKSLTVPNNTVMPLEIKGPAGFFELLVIASKTPLRDALIALERVAAVRGNRGNDFYNLEPDEAVNIMEFLLSDLDESSRSGSGYTGSALGVDTSKLAAISQIFRVVEP